MKVFIISGTYYPNIFGGAEKVAQDLAEALVLRGHEVVVATLNPRRRHEVAEVNGARVHYLPNWNLYFSGPPRRRHIVSKLAWRALDLYNPAMAGVLGHMLEAERPDVVNTHNIAGFSVSAWSAARSRGLPLVHTIHDYYLLCLRGSMWQKEKDCREPCVACRLCSRPLKRFSELVDLVVPVSRSVLERHNRFGYFGRAEKVVIHDRGYVEDALRCSGVRREGDGAVRFGYLGRLHRTKGVRTLLRSFLGLPPARAELLIAGRGAPDYERELRQMADGRNGIRLLGFVSPAQLLRHVDVLVVPSLWHDPSPLAVTEAMAYGVPVIGSCRGGIPELMGEGTGWTFDPDQPGALMGAMQQAIDCRGELAAMGERARERARLFSTKAMVDAYLAVYSRAVEKSKAGTGP